MYFVCISIEPSYKILCLWWCLLPLLQSSGHQPHGHTLRLHCIHLHHPALPMLIRPKEKQEGSKWGRATRQLLRWGAGLGSCLCTGTPEGCCCAHKQAGQHPATPVTNYTQRRRRRGHACTKASGAPCPSPQQQQRPSDFALPAGPSGGHFAHCLCHWSDVFCACVSFSCLFVLECWGCSRRGAVRQGICRACLRVF